MKQPMEERVRSLLGQAEGELVEFKQAGRQYDGDKLGRYFSALCNEANLASKDRAWLLLGVNPETHFPDAEGTQAYLLPEHRAAAKKGVSDSTGTGISFVDIHEVFIDGIRLVLFEIPAAPRGIPVAWKGHFYARQGESLVPLDLEKLERIRQQGQQQDWSAQVAPSAGIKDLDPEALRAARLAFVDKNQDKANLSQWLQRASDMEFLQKLRLAMDGKITFAALLLLGRAESTLHLSPAVAEITWILRNGGVKRDYQHFYPPFLLATDALKGKIRNLTLRELPQHTLFPKEIPQYDDWVIRELLHNCIAHQDYSRCERILVEEDEVSLTFRNAGAFIPLDIKTVLDDGYAPTRYRNTVLAQAMVQLKMIDTLGSGIRKTFDLQKNRAMPLPSYDLSSPERVSVKLDGQIRDANYTRLLLTRTDLSLNQVLALDEIQKTGDLHSPAFLQTLSLRV